MSLQVTLLFHETAADFAARTAADPGVQGAYWGAWKAYVDALGQAGLGAAAMRCCRPAPASSSSARTGRRRCWMAHQVFHRAGPFLRVPGSGNTGMTRGPARDRQAAAQGRFATASTSTSAPRARAVTPMQTRLGRAPGGKASA